MATQANPEQQSSEKEKAVSLLAPVPAGHGFKCIDGKVFTDMKELAEGLAAMTDQTFQAHFNAQKNDFSNWVRDEIKDEKLADELLTARSRMEAIGIVTSRLTYLRGYFC